MSESRISELRNKIDRADAIYYNGGNSGIADSLYDQWKDELEKLYPKDERFTRIGAPVSADSTLTKRQHKHFMGSQNKATTPDEFATWYKNVGQPEVFVNLKVDGASVRAYYEKGKIQHVVTRGDGVEGEDITSNAYRWIDFPIHTTMDFYGSVRGEAVLFKKEWEIVDPDLLSNPRNLGSGIIQRSDGENNHYMRFLSFDYTDDLPKLQAKTEVEKIELMRRMGFEVVTGKLCKNLAEIMALYEHIQTARANLPFWIDGLVVKINDIKKQEDLGITNNRPKGQISFKFPPEQAETILTGYTLAVGHTGAISITAILKPVRLGGTTISNATLHNWENIKMLDVAVGDTVIIHKGGEIIPQVVEVKTRPKDRQPILEPTECPECCGAVGRRTKLGKKAGKVTDEESAITECKNPDCEAKGEGKIKRFVTGVDILGMGDTLRSTLYNLGMVRKVSDLYKLDVNSLALVKSGNIFGESRAKDLIAEINKKRELTIEQFMGSLGINSLARGRVADICSNCPGEFGTVSDWLSGKLISMKDKAGVPNIADKIQKGIDTIRPMIEELVGPIGIKIIQPVVKVKPIGPLTDKTFCMTGEFSRKKAEIAVDIEAAGGEVWDSVKKGLTYLVVDDLSTTSTKMQKATKMKISVIVESDLTKLING